MEQLENNELKVYYPDKASAVTPGQFCVFYQNDECLGSGIIKKVMKDDEELWYLK